MLTMEGFGSGGGVVVTLVARSLSTTMSLAQDPVGDVFPVAACVRRFLRSRWVVFGFRHQPQASGAAVVGDVWVA